MDVFPCTERKFPMYGRDPKIKCIYGNNRFNTSCNSISLQPLPSNYFHGSFKWFPQLRGMISWFPLVHGITAMDPWNDFNRYMELFLWVHRNVSVDYTVTSNPLEESLMCFRVFACTVNFSVFLVEFFPTYTYSICIMISCIFCTVPLPPLRDKNTVR